MTNFRSQSSENVQRCNDSSDNQSRSPENLVRDCANRLMREFPEFWNEMRNQSDTSQPHLPGLEITDSDGDGDRGSNVNSRGDNGNSNRGSDRDSDGESSNSPENRHCDGDDGSHESPRWHRGDNHDNSDGDISENRHRDDDGRSGGGSHDSRSNHRNRDRNNSGDDQDSSPPPEAHHCDGDGDGSQPPEETPPAPDCPETPTPEAPETPCNPEPPVTAPPEAPSLPETPPVTAPPEAPPEAPPSAPAPPEAPPCAPAPPVTTPEPPSPRELEATAEQFFNRTEFAAKTLLGKFKAGDKDNNGKLSAEETRDILKELTPFAANAIRDRLLKHWSGIKSGAIDGRNGVSEADLTESIERQQQKAALRGFNTTA